MARTIYPPGVSGKGRDRGHGRLPACRPGRHRVRRPCPPDREVPMPYPHLLAPIRLGDLELRNRVVMGSMHTGLEDKPWDVPKLAAFYRRAGARRGRPHDHRRVRRQPAGLAQAVRRPDDDPAAGDAARADHGGGPRRGRRDRAAAAPQRPLRLPPVQRRRLRDPVAHHAVQAARALHEGGAPDRRRLRTVGRARAQGRLRRGRDHGLRGLPDQPVPHRPHQRPDRRVGRVGLGPDAVPGARRRADPRAARRRLPDRLPDLAARPRRRRPDLGRDRRAGAAARGRGRDRVQHRHRLARGAGPHDHHPGPARHLDAVDRSAAGGRRRPGDRLQPDQHPRARRAAAGRRHRRPGRRWRGRSWPTPTSSARPPRTGPTRSTPASRATRPAWTTRSRTAPRPAWSTRAPAARRRSCSPPPGGPRRSRSSAPVPAGLAAAVSAAERGFSVTLFEAGPAIGGQFRLAMEVPGKEDFTDTLRYYARRLEVLGVEVRLSTRRRRRRPRDVRRGGDRDRRDAAHPGDRRASTTRRSCRTPTCWPAGSCPVGGSP